MSKLSVFAGVFIFLLVVGALAIAVIGLSGAVAAVSLVAVIAQIGALFTQCLVGLGLLGVFAALMLRNRMVIAILSKRLGLDVHEVDRPLAARPAQPGQLPEPKRAIQIVESAPRTYQQLESIDENVLKHWGW